MKNSDLSCPVPFWKAKTPEEMTDQEWESLCDRCGRCCAQKVEDPKTKAVFYTTVACRLLNISRCECLDYKKRLPDCMVLTPERVRKYYWLPHTCAYRLIIEGRDLPEWHPLVSGDPETVHRSGNSLRDKAISEEYVNPDELEAYILEDTFYVPSP